MPKKHLLAAVMILAASVLSAGILEFSCTANKKDAIFKAGEKIVFTARIKEDGKAVWEYIRSITKK